MAKNKKKQHSITTQITLTIVGLVAGTVLLCWLLNVTLLEGYYTRYKQEVLENGFQQINAASEQGILNTSDYDIDFEKICSNGNLTILIITSDGTVPSVPFLYMYTLFHVQLHRYYSILA